MIEQRFPRRRLLAGLLTGAALAAAGPFLSAVAGQSGSEPATEVRRGAEVRWSVPTADGEGYFDYRFWVWQAGYSEVTYSYPPGMGTGAGTKGQAVAARRTCWTWTRCSGFSYWRGPAGDDVALAGNTFWMDIATGLARFEGTLTRANGEPCTVVMEWSSADPWYTETKAPTPWDPNAAAWRRWGRAQGPVSCWPALDASTSSQIWVSTGI